MSMMQMLASISIGEALIVITLIACTVLIIKSRK